MEDFKIDMVYLWVDSNDEKWKEKKNKFLNNSKNYDAEAVCDGRFEQIDELKYSLRSLEKYANWINHIYIITDEQAPKWLNLNNDRITIVDHKDIFDNSKLPTFNSMAIETQIANIKGLSEYFLYANDDFFFYKKTGKKFFFNKKKMPICRFISKFKNQRFVGQYGLNVKYTHDLMSQKFNKNVPYFTHHCIDSYTKTNILSCIADFRDEYERTSKMRFREFNALERTGYSYWAVMSGKGVFKKIPKRCTFDYLLGVIGITRFDSMVFANTKKGIDKKLKIFKPHIFCINDGEQCQKEDRARAKSILEKIYPKKSSFEI